MNIQTSLFDIVKEESLTEELSNKELLKEELLKEELPIADGKLAYYPRWINEREAASLFICLRQDIQWQQSTIRLYGKHIKIPRLNAWYGDKHCAYEYSGTRFDPQPWLPSMLNIKHRIESLTGFRFNSVLVNCYRDGNDSVAWHSDDEPELGRNPAVASLSLGAERVFQLRHRHNKMIETQKMILGDGSLLLMSGELQHHWKHQIPKSQKQLGERINLTFRYVIPNSERL